MFKPNRRKNEKEDPKIAREIPQNELTKIGFCLPNFIMQIL